VYVPIAKHWVQTPVLKKKKCFYYIPIRSMLRIQESNPVHKSIPQKKDIRNEIN
jgi:hypothetical protein